MVNSSLAYEVLIYINSFYFGLFATCEISTLILKGVMIMDKYLQGRLLMEAGIMLALCVVESSRIYLGRKGTLANRDIPVLFSVPLTIPSVLGVVYFLAFQNKIIKIEYMWCFLMLALLSTELIFGMFFILTMCKAPSYD